MLVIGFAIGVLLVLSSSCLPAADAKQLKWRLNEDGKAGHVGRYPDQSGRKNHHFIPRDAFNNYGGSDNGGG